MENTRPVLSETPGNPAHALRQAYDRLMAIEDPQELHDEAFKLIGGGVFLERSRDRAKGISLKNWGKALRALKATLASRDPLTNLRRYVTNFILAADNLRVI